MNTTWCGEPCAACAARWGIERHCPALALPYRLRAANQTPQIKHQGFPVSRQPFRTLAAVILCVASIAATVHAQSPATTAAVTEYVKAEMQRQHIPGLSLLVAKAGKIIRAEGFGLANVEL